MKKEKETNPMYEAWRKQRGDWGAIKPITRRIDDKKHHGKIKYGKRDLERKCEE